MEGRVIWVKPARRTLSVSARLWVMSMELTVLDGSFFFPAGLYLMGSRRGHVLFFAKHKKRTRLENKMIVFVGFIS